MRKPKPVGDYVLVAYPKCGRTWLRLMVGKALSTHFRLTEPRLLELDRLTELHPAVPFVTVTHDHRPHLKTPDELPQSKAEYAEKAVILLIRDPRDVIVSYYFDYTRRRRRINPAKFSEYNGDLPSFLRSERGGFRTLIEFYNIWAENQTVPADFMLVRYEDLHRDAEGQLLRVLSFLGLEAIPRSVVRDVVDFASFENMRRMEIDDVFETNRLRAVDPADPESFKTRRGKVGGFVDYLNADDMRYVDTAMEALTSFYRAAN